MYCVNCGKELKAQSKFCPECGTKVIQEENVIIENETAEQELKAEAVQEEKITVEEIPQEKVNEDTVEQQAKTEEVAAEKSTADTGEQQAKVEDTPEQKSTADTVKEKLDDAVDSAKKAGKEFAESETVQNAKKEVNDIFNEAKAASNIQAGTATEGETVVPRQEVSFMVDWFYWTGRRSRLKYLMITIFTSLCSLALGSTVIFSLLFCYMSAVNLVKRLHDCDKSGWFAFLLMLIEYLILNLTWLFGLIGIGLAAAGSMSGLLLWLIPLLIVWAIKLWVFFVPGTKGPNRYGPEPK